MNVTPEEFNDALLELLQGKSVEEILDTPGVYERLAARFEDEAYARAIEAKAAEVAEAS
jgi:hypothetical protein